MKKLIIIIFIFVGALQAQNSGISEAQRTLLLLSSKSAYPFLNAEASDWYDRVVANGGHVSDATKEAVDSFFIMIDDSSLRNLMIRVNLFAGKDLNSALAPQIISDYPDSATIGYTTDLNVNFVEGDYSESVGLGDLSNIGKYLNTGVNPSLVPELDINSAGLGVYIITDIGGVTPIGAYNSTYFVLSLIDSTYRTRLFNSSSINYNVGSDFNGYWDGNRTAGNAQDLYGHGILKSHLAIAPVAKPNKEIYVFAMSIGSNPTASDQRIYGGYTIHKGLTSDQERALDNIIEHFQDKLGRGVEP